MAITPDQVELVARRVADDLLKPPNKWDRDVDDRMTREAAAPVVYSATRELIAAVAGNAAPDEVLGGPPPGWHPDPFRRYQLRYWDGAGWSQHVSTNGVATVDPLNR